MKANFVPTKSSNDLRKAKCCPLGRILILPVFAIWLTGCVGMVVPVPSHDKTHGQVITREQTKFIVCGQTSRGAVVKELGGEFRASPRLPALAYSWEQPATGLLWFWVIVLPPGGLGDGDFTERSHWRAFFVAFDGADKVSRAEFVSLRGGRSLDEQLEDWAAGKSRNGFHVFNPDTGAPLFVEVPLKHLNDRRTP